MNILILTLALTAQTAISKPDPARQPLDVREHIAVTEKAALACRAPSDAVDTKTFKDILTEGAKIELRSLLPLKMTFTRDQQKEAVSLRVIESPTKAGSFLLEKTVSSHKDKDDDPLSQTTQTEIDEALSQKLIGFAELLRPVKLSTQQTTSPKVGLLEPVTLGICKSPKFDRFNRRTSKALTKFDYRFELEDSLTAAKQTFELKNSMAAALLQMKEVNLSLGTDATEAAYCIFQVQSPKAVDGVKSTPSLALVDEALSASDAEVQNALKSFEDFVKVLDESQVTR